MTAPIPDARGTVLPRDESDARDLEPAILKAPWCRRPLFNPGPVSLTPTVRESLSWPDVCHRDLEFLSVFSAVRERVGGVYGTRFADGHDCVAFAGSGAAAVDAALLDSIAYGGATVVLVGGPYATRMCRTIDNVGAPGYAVAVDPSDDELPERLASSLRAGTRRVAMVHHDTATATMSSVDAVSRVCRERGLDLVVDCVSSFACEPLPVDTGVRTWWATCSNKALEAAPGVALCLRPAQLSGPRRSCAPITLDLAYHHEQQARGDTAFTLPTQIVASLHVALEELEAQGGWRARQRVYERRSARVRERLGGCGLWPVLDGPVVHASALTLAKLPAGETFQSFSERLWADGLRVYPAQGPHGDRCFRVAVMGALSDGDTERLLDAICELVP